MSVSDRKKAGSLRTPLQVSKQLKAMGEKPKMGKKKNESQIRRFNFKEIPISVDCREKTPNAVPSG